MQLVSELLAPLAVASAACGPGRAGCSTSPATCRVIQGCCSIWAADGRSNGSLTKQAWAVMGRIRGGGQADA